MKNNLPLEKQVCTLEQAKKLAKLLGEHAPPSLWVWLKNDADDFPFELILVDDEISNEFYTYYPAYTGDELTYCLYKNLRGRKMPYSANQKAILSISGLVNGWIKPKDFKYV